MRRIRERPELSDMPIRSFEEWDALRSGLAAGDR
jgi:hypothetical protein